MTKSELILTLTERFSHLSQRDIERVVETVFDQIIDSLALGDRVEIRGFGAFSVKKKGNYIGRNPRTGETISVNSRYSPSFKIGKELHNKINEALLEMA